MELLPASHACVTVPRKEGVQDSQDPGPEVDPIYLDDDWDDEEDEPVERIVNIPEKGSLPQASPGAASAKTKPSATASLIDIWSSVGTASEDDGGDAAGTEALRVIDSAGAVPNASPFTRLIQDHARSAAAGDMRALDKAFQVLDDMQRKGVRRDLLTYTALISVCAKSAGAGHGVHAVDRGMQGLQAMQKDGIQPDVVAYNILLDACAKAASVGDQFGLERGFRLLRMLRDANLKPTIITYNTLMHTCAKSSSPKNAKAMEMALGLIDGMSQTNVKPDIVTYNALVDTCARGGAGGLQRAVAVLDDMQASGLTPDIVTYNSLVNACARAAGERDTSAFGTAMQVLKKMQASSVEANVVTFNSLMTIIARGAATGDIPDPGAALSQGTQVIGMMLTDELQPNIITFNALVTAIVKAAVQSMEPCDKELRRALSLMEQAGVQPNSVTFVLIMDLFASQGKSPVEAGLVTIDLLESAGLEADGGAYKTMIDNCVRAGAGVKSVMPVLERMQRAGCTPPINIFNSLLSILAKPGEGGCDYAFEMLKFMQQADVVLNDDTFSILTSIRAADEASGAQPTGGLKSPFPDLDPDFHMPDEGECSDWDSDEEDDESIIGDENNTEPWITIREGSYDEPPFWDDGQVSNPWPRKAPGSSFSARQPPPFWEGSRPGVAPFDDNYDVAPLVLDPEDDETVIISDDPTVVSGEIRMDEFDD